MIEGCEPESLESSGQITREPAMALAGVLDGESVGR
jgi:hypothetical protein